MKGSEEQGQQGAPGSMDDGAMRHFIDALTRYAIDPGQWGELLEQFDRMSDRLENWDPTKLVAELSRAESLSWRLKGDSGNNDRPGFAYLLLDDQDRVTGSSDNLHSLAEYLTVGDDGVINFSHPDSRLSLNAARDALRAERQAHSLVSLAHPRKAGQRFGFLITRSEFPPQLEPNNASAALFVSEDENDARLHGVVQASFGLTAMETDVTMKLARGMTLKEAASDLGISVNTARNHLQAVFSKSGINRQSDLVLVITQLSVILAGTESDAAAAARRNASRTPPRHFVILPDGRRMAYRTYGSARGTPIVYLHETLGCSRLPPATGVLAEDLGLNIIAPERPGTGFSDVDPSFSFDSITADLLHLMDHLRIETTTMLGFLSGGAFALWLANRHPERVARLVLVASRPPAPQRGRFQHLMPLYTKMTSHPWLMTSFFNILRNRASEATNARLIKNVYGSVPHDEAYLEAHPDMFEHMITYTMEAMTVTATGVASELKCFASIKQEPFSGPGPPISAWHGNADNLSAVEDLFDYLKDARSVTWRRFEEAGSLILLEHWGEILKDAAGVAE